MSQAQEIKIKEEPKLVKPQLRQRSIMESFRAQEAVVKEEPRATQAMTQCSVVDLAPQDEEDKKPQISPILNDLPKESSSTYVPEPKAQYDIVNEESSIVDLPTVTREDGDSSREVEHKQVEETLSTTESKKSEDDIVETHVIPKGTLCTVRYRSLVVAPTLTTANGRRSRPIHDGNFGGLVNMKRFKKVTIFHFVFSLFTDLLVSCTRGRQQLASRHHWC
jgi:hypothetical protein